MAEAVCGDRVSGSAAVPRPSASSFMPLRRTPGHRPPVGTRTLACKPHFGSRVRGTLRSDIKGEPRAAGRRTVAERRTPQPRAREVYERDDFKANSSSLNRNTRRCTLPVVVMGSAAMTSISLGYS